MGSWNTTCGLTNLPILTGTPVHVFPIKEKNTRTYRSHCETDAFYSPCLFSFKAIYDDGGQYTDYSGPVLDTIMQQLYSALNGTGSRAIFADSRMNHTIAPELFFRLTLDNDIRVYDGNWRNGAPVFYTAIRADVIDRLWQEWSFTEYYRFSDDSRGYLTLTFEEINDMVPEYVDRIPVVEEKDLIILMDVDTGDPLMDNFSRLSQQSPWDLIKYRNTVLKHVREGNNALAVELIREQLKGVMVSHFMTKTRNVWLPNVHEGSQSEQYEEHQLLADITRDVAEIDKRRWDEDE